MKLHCGICHRSFKGLKGTAWCDCCKMEKIIEMRDEKKAKDKAKEEKERPQERSEEKEEIIN